MAVVHLMLGSGRRQMMVLTKLDSISPASRVVVSNEPLYQLADPRSHATTCLARTRI